MSAPFQIVIHHNPDCGTSRNVLEIIKASDITNKWGYSYLGWTDPWLADNTSGLGSSDISH